MKLHVQVPNKELQAKIERWKNCMRKKEEWIE